MPTVTIDTSAEMGDPRAFLTAAHDVLAKAAKCPVEHTHITLRDNQTMTFGGKLGGVDGPHVAQVRVTVSQKLDNKAKNAIIQGLGKGLAPAAPKAQKMSFTPENIGYFGKLELTMPATTAITAARRRRCAISRASACFQRASGPIAIRKSSGSMIGTKTELK